MHCAMYMLVTERMVYVAACLRELAVFRLKNYWTRGHRKFLCRCISDMYAFYFVFDVLPYLLYCHITYCLHNIVSGHPVLLLLKIDWLLYFISAECSETSSPFLIPKLMSACVVFFYFPHSDEDLLLQCFDTVFENTYFMFFSYFKKTWLFTFFWNDVSKSRKKSLAKV